MAYLTKIIEVESDLKNAITANSGSLVLHFQGGTEQIESPCVYVTIKEGHQLTTWYQSGSAYHSNGVRVNVQFDILTDNNETTSSYSYHQSMVKQVYDKYLSNIAIYDNNMTGHKLLDMWPMDKSVNTDTENVTTQTTIGWDGTLFVSASNFRMN